MRVPVGFKRLNSKAKTPKFATSGSHCLDLYVCLDTEDLVECRRHSSAWSGNYIESIRPQKLPSDETGLLLQPEHNYRIPTGLAFEIPEGFAMKIFIRSSSAYKRGITLVNSVGVIDSDYRDQLFLLVRVDSPCFLHDGERIAQGELVRSDIKPEFEAVETIKSSASRSGGIGSTGEQ